LLTVKTVKYNCEYNTTKPSTVKGHYTLVQKAVHINREVTFIKN